MYSTERPWKRPRPAIKTPDLPILSYREDIVKAVRQHRVVVLVGETGSGKTTQVPRFLYEENVSNRPGSISITQPRRIAAISVANRVASELGCEVGGLVGFHVRFSNCTSSETRIKYMTDGMLVRESAAGGLRSGIRGSSIVILDEAHERSIHTDVLLGLVKKALDQDDPPGLRVVVMSATIHAAPFVNFFGSKEVKLIQVPGRQHAVQVFYTPSPEPDVLEAALVAVLQLHVSRPPGDVLVFLPGQDDIDNLHRLLEEKQEMLAKERQENPDKKVAQQGDFYNGVNLWPTFQQVQNLLIRPIYSSLPFDQQELVFQQTPPGCREIVLATNIAETSITISGIRCVIDTGLMKLKMSHPQTGVQMLRTVPTSQASALQRAGRAGREAPGEVFRLYVESEFDKLLAQTPAEILRVDMASVYMDLKALGISKIVDFPLVDRPPREALEKAAHFLCRIGALDTKDELTDLGRKLSMMPLDPLYAYCLNMSFEFDCTAEILSIIAMLSADAPIFATSKQRAQTKAFEHEDGDHLSLLSAFNQWKKHQHQKVFASQNGLNHAALEKAVTIRKQLKDVLHQAWGATQISSCGGPKNWATVRRCLLKGLFTQSARRDEVNQNSYRTFLSRQEAKLHPTSVLHRRQLPPPCVIYNELVITAKSYLRVVTEVDPAWLPELCPRFFCTS